MKDNAKSVLEIRNVDLSYGKDPVLHNVNLSVYAGEFWFFLGPNGEGKTTLVRAILGEIRPRAGSLIFGHGLTTMKSMSFIPQHCDLNPTLPTTAGEFISLGLTGLSVTREERRHRRSWALERVGLSGMADRNYWTLSGGQRQRVLVARALIRRPSLLVLDEPAKGMDFSSESVFLELLRNLNREEKLTIIFVSHNIDIAARYGTHAALFSKMTVLSGETANVLTSLNLERVFGIPIRDCRGSSETADIRAEGEQSL